MTILDQIKAGRLVVVPSASDIAMDKAGIAAIANAMGATGGVPGWAASDCYKAMLTASPDHTTALLSLVEGMERVKALVDNDVRLMDPPDGGDPTTPEKVGNLRRMSDAFEARALAAEAERDALREALAWLGEKKSRSLSFDGRTFCEDDNSDLWTVTEERGSRNDREWVVLGSGNTPTEALLNASTAARAPRRPAND